ncbi:unnamed protein product [Dibothriocephalus latus]|uniref:Uncharacterized protein n=1 Tax=Dibothriocephalus latus TaxID=60516 RepID=A0A3P7M8W9_DIBLA|nr:unnamed protein product [Dibothriocephalus latus]
MFNAVYSFPILYHTGIQDVRQAEPAEVCARRLRHLIYSVIFNLEKGDRRNLHGVRGPAARPQDSKEPLTTTASSSIILATLAFSVAAFALHETLQTQLLSQDVLLADCIAQHLGRMDCPEAAEASLNFDYLHTYAQLQITYSTLITLGAVLTTTMASMEPVDFGSLDQVMLCFPSGRLAHRLAVRLSLLPQGERQKEVCEVIFPRLVEEGRRDTTSPCLTQNALSQLTANYARIIAFVDRLLEGRR